MLIWLIRSRIRATNEERDNSLLAEYIQLLRESSTSSEDEDDEELPEDSNNNYE
ncbi:hypothetical protein [Myxosarcina sp. GI1(2024)]